MVRIPEQSGQYLASLVVLGGWGWAWGGGVFWSLLWDSWAGVNGRVLSPLVLEVGVEWMGGQGEHGRHRHGVKDRYSVCAVHWT